MMTLKCYGFFIGLFSLYFLYRCELGIGLGLRKSKNARRILRYNFTGANKLQ